MRRLRKMIINGEYFTLKNEIVNYNNIKELEYKSLNQCYVHCSNLKECIFNYWNNKLFSNSIAYGIKNYNSNMITLHSILMINNKLYYAYITKSNNYLYEVAE